MKYSLSINCPPPESDFNLGNNVHIWTANIDHYISINIEFDRYLSQDELKRARNYKFNKDRDRFAATRNILRALLAKYLTTHPKDIQFLYNNHGKPYINEKIHFNVSHSNEMALYAFTNIGHIGIDIEKIQPIADLLEISKQYFSDNEIQTLRSLKLEKQLISFFNCWTRKEAFVKAVGTGLSQSLNEFSVTCRPEEPPGISFLENTNIEGNWKLHSLDEFKSYSAAFVLDGEFDKIVISNYI